LRFPPQGPNIPDSAKRRYLIKQFVQLWRLPIENPDFKLDRRPPRGLDIKAKSRCGCQRNVNDIRLHEKQSVSFTFTCHNRRLFLTTIFCHRHSTPNQFLPETFMLIRTLTVVEYRLIYSRIF
jgi:hypothetical protein